MLIGSQWLNLDFGVTPVTRIQIRDLVRRWHELSNRVEMSRAVFPLGAVKRITATEAAQQAKFITSRLAENLQFPALLDTLPRRIRQLKMILDDSLHGFPFSAISYQDQFLVQRYSMCVHYEHCSIPAKSEPNSTALIVGISQSAENFPPLPGTLVEVDKLETWFRLHKLVLRKLINLDATKSAVVADLTEATIAHLACHGIFEHNRPEGSGLVLLASSDKIDVLSLRDLSRLDLHKLKHITLSSCWGADHFVLPGRWVISLPETLYRAGAHSILGSLWEVNGVLC